MVDFKNFSGLALDISERNASREHQESLASLIQSVLAKGYQICLFSSKENDDLSGEEFDQPELAVAGLSGPPWETLARQEPAFRNPATLWVTEEPGLQQWLAEQGFCYAFVKSPTTPGPGSVRLGRLNDLLPLLDPTSRVAEQIATAIARVPAARRRKTMLVGLGGPPESGFRDFALTLKLALETLEMPLVNLVDLSPLLFDSAGAAAQPRHPGAWEHPEAGQWVLENVLSPFHAGARVFFEFAPPHLPPGFQAHFPLFLSEETVALIMGEMLFIPEILPLLDYSILLEVSPQETTRRIFEIAPGKTFDSKFTEQYLLREGRVYGEYLRRHKVAAKVSQRVDAGQEGALKLAEGAPGPKKGKK